VLEIWFGCKKVWLESTPTEDCPNIRGCIMACVSSQSSSVAFTSACLCGKAESDKWSRIIRDGSPFDEGGEK